MKIILLGSILGNLPALEACLARAEEEGYDLLLHTGNVVGHGPYPDECMETLRQRGIMGVRGRWEDALAPADAIDVASTLAATPGEQALARQALEWNLRRMRAATRIEADALPFELRRGVGGRTLGVFHAGPVSLMDRVTPGMPQEALTAVLDAAGAEIVGLGLSPEPFHKEMGGRHIISAPRAGAPGARQTGYAVITSGARVQVEFRVVACDTGRAAGEAARRGLPPDVARLFPAG